MGKPAQRTVETDWGGTESCTMALKVSPRSLKASRCVVLALMTLKKFPEAAAQLGRRTRDEVADMAVLRLHIGIGMCSWADRRSQRTRFGQVVVRYPVGCSLLIAS